jgi:hypothetical protein
MPICNKYSKIIEKLIRSEVEMGTQTGSYKSQSKDRKKSSGGM